MATLSRLLLLAAIGIVLTALAYVGLQFPYLCLLLLAVAVAKRSGGWVLSRNFGSARLATVYDLIRHRLIGEARGLILGRASGSSPPTRWQAVRALMSPAITSVLAVRLFLSALRYRGDDSLIRVRDYVHLLTCAPAGSGKSTSVLIPNLLNHEGSVVVTDPMGELYRKTAAQRRAMGHRVFKLDPFNLAGPPGESDAFNPCDFLDENSINFHDDARSQASLLVETEGQDIQPHFNLRALDILAAMIAFVCGCEADAGKRTLTVVRDLISSPAGYREAIRTMQQVPGLHGILSLLGDQLTWLKGRELESVLSSLFRHIGWLNSPAVTACITRSTFDPRWLWSQKATVYIIVPHDKMTTMAPLMKWWLGSILQIVANNGRTEKFPVLFMVDEAAHLGRLKPLEEAITLLRGNGIRVWLFLQSLDQMKKCYGESASIMLDNIGTQQYFGTTSFETGDHLSKRIGDTTILVESINRNISYSRPTGFRPGADSSGNVSSSEGTTLNETGRRLIKPEEFLVLPRNSALILHKNLPPIAAQQVHYYEAPEFAKGGTGQSRRLGLSAVLAASITLAASLGFAAVMLSLPSPQLLRQMAFSPAGNPAATARPGRQPASPAARRPASVRSGDLPLYYGDPLYGPAQPVTSPRSASTHPLGPIIRRKGASFGQ